MMFAIVCVLRIGSGPGAARALIRPQNKKPAALSMHSMHIALERILRACDPNVLSSHERQSLDFRDCSPLCIHNECSHERARDAAHGKRGPMVRAGKREIETVEAEN